MPSFSTHNRVCRGIQTVTGSCMPLQSKAHPAHSSTRSFLCLPKRARRVYLSSKKFGKHPVAEDWNRPDGND
eukprot:3568742-Rhodomonas_salina.2